MLYKPTIIGLDFSGAALAGEKIWLATAQIETDSLRITTLQRGADLPSSGAQIETVLPALVDFLAAQPGALVGCDFPFSLHCGALQNQSWRQWLQDVAENFADAQSFKDAFPDQRRRCDIEAKTPLSPLNLRLFRQTFHGLRDVLWPLVEQHRAVVLPFLPARENALTLLEVCPASLLKQQKLYLSYKGKNGAQRANREIILGEIATRFRLQIAPELAEKAVENSEGDALDAVLGALCVWNALGKNKLDATPSETQKREGHVYF